VADSGPYEQQLQNLRANSISSSQSAQERGGANCLAKASIDSGDAESQSQMAVRKSNNATSTMGAQEDPKSEAAPGSFQ
jgi:hypothetical protein